MNGLEQFVCTFHKAHCGGYVCAGNYTKGCELRSRNTNVYGNDVCI